MEFSPPAMKPAFYGRWHLLSWISLLIVILGSPVLTTLAVSPSTRYLVMSKRVGNSDWHASQMFSATAPLDILIMGNSRMLNAFDHSALQQEMLKRGAQVNSETIAANWNGYDLTYTFLKDFFARRQARLVVINYPGDPQTDSHPAEKYVRRFDLSDPGLDIRRPILAATNYGEMALVGFRLALASIVRPEPVDLKWYRSMGEGLPPDFNLDKMHGSLVEYLGFQEDRTIPRAPFVPRVLPDTPAGAMIVGVGAPLPEEVALTNAPLTEIESAYLPAIKALCEKNGAALALMIQPRGDAAERRTIEVSRAVLALRIPVIAVSLERMFGNATTEQIREHYEDGRHFNANGMRQSARVYAAALEELLEKAGGR
jgi:hypothetical protein